MTEAFQGYRFNDAASLLYQFLWHEYCDWYLEIVKNRLAGPDPEERKRTGRILLARALEQAMRLLHPIMPFLTEEIWQRLPHDGRQRDDGAVAAGRPGPGLPAIRGQHGNAHGDHARGAESSAPVTTSRPRSGSPWS